MAIRLGVNIDHLATLKKVRGNTTDYPNILLASQVAAKAGAEQITIHLREDRRHIQDKDVEMLCKESPLPINLEMAVSDEMLKIAIKNKPAWVCLVPEKREELTTEGGLDVATKLDEISYIVKELSKHGIATSTFVEPDTKQIGASAQAGVKAIELHTGKWVALSGQAKQVEWTRLVAASNSAESHKIFVHAGHGLDYEHTKEICKLPYLREVNIGHSIICYAVFEGLENVLIKMKNLLSS